MMNKSITDVALELGWEALKDFVGWNDLMGSCRWASTAAVDRVADLG